MGLFDIFRKKPKFVDDFFGELAYTTFKDPSKNFYNGTIRFQGQGVGINLDADEKGPTKEQKDFFINLDKDYQKIKNDIIIPFLKKELADNVENSGVDKFDTEFEFDGICINRITDNPVEWSITYDSKLMEHYVSIDFEGMTPKYMTIDG